MSELASQRGISLSALSEAVIELTGGLRDTESKAAAIIELASMPEDEAAALIELSAKSATKRDEDMSDEDIEDDGPAHG